MNQFSKMLIVNGTEILFRKTVEQHGETQVLLIVVHCYFHEFIPLGFLPEAILKMPVCCLQHLDEMFNDLDEHKAKIIIEQMRKMADAKKQVFMNNIIKHN